MSLIIDIIFFLSVLVYVLACVHLVIDVGFGLCVCFRFGIHNKMICYKGH